MTDEELLELAAKACQWTLEYDDNERLSWIIWSDNNVPIYRWNPLTDDGDALRLAVKLGVLLGLETIHEPSGYVRIAADWDKDTGWPRVSFEQPHKGDPCAATRRAIVMAAAEIGKGMK
jgi:hypothetical protein